MKNFHVKWHILDRCNQRCAHCYQEEFTRARELDLDVLIRTADNMLEAMRAWDARLEIALTGGEPLLKEELFPLMEHLAASPRLHRLHLITNGVLLSRHLDHLKIIKKFKEIRISLDGASPETHDAIRGAGAFDATVQNIRVAREAGFTVLLMFTAMKSNAGDVLLMPNLCRELDATGFILERFIPLGNGRALRDEVLDGPQFLLLWNALLDLLGMEAAPEELIKYRGIKVARAGNARRIFGSECIVGCDGMAVMPDATIYPCRRLPIPAGNLLQESLTRIWETSDVIRNLQGRGNLKGACHDCAVEGCVGCRAMTYALTGDYLAEDPHCWMVK